MLPNKALQSTPRLCFAIARGRLSLAVRRRLRPSVLYLKAKMQAAIVRIQTVSDVTQTAGLTLRFDTGS